MSDEDDEIGFLRGLANADLLSFLLWAVVWPLLMIFVSFPLWIFCKLFRR